MIKTVIFDIGNVLTEFCWSKYFEVFGYSEEILKRLAKATVLSEDWKEYDLGNLGDEEVLDLFIANDPSIEKELRASLRNVDGILEQCDYTIPWIEELKAKGYQVLYLSNFSEKVLRDCARIMGFLSHMDGGILSCRVHFVKPDPAIYKLLLQKYGLLAEECVFLDDTAENIKAAEALGIHGIVFENQAQARKELEKLGVG
ncbi:MAG: HAD family phosphatase [Lachnospiraceae bacterium]|nr:HAD family phosphatase [Lachnospiraceae bacterium]